MQKILVIESERLLGAAIVSVLYPEAELDVLGYTPDTVSGLVDKITHLCPDVVIIDFASHFAEAFHLLPARCRSELRLMTVSADDNWVNIDYRHQALITKRSDLADIIQGNQDPLSSGKSTQDHKGEASSYVIP